MNHQTFRAIVTCLTRRICGKQRTRLRTIALALLLPLIGTTPLAAQGNCQAVDDATNKMYATPTHLYTTMDNIKNEMIYVGGTIYDKVSGKWARSQVTMQQVMKFEQDNRQHSKYTCRYLRDEAVNGEAAAVYSTHAERSDLAVKSDGQIWISKTRGLPLRHEGDIDLGGGSKKHESTRYEYANVQPPL
ncbi:MAG TPA: hypothetical protein VI685_11655 [Candidatus Angelobacter sp.]